MVTNTFLLHAIIITPICQWILQSNKWKKPWNLYYAIGFLVVVGLAGEFHSYSQQPPNYYQILGVDRATPPPELKRAYRDASLKYHPDKNPSPEAAILFNSVSEAYNTLSDTSSRLLYDKHGIPSSADARTKASITEMSTIFHMFSFYFIWGILTYLFTLGKANNSGRTWSFVGLILCLFLEFSMLFQNYDLPFFLLPRTTIKEKIELLHSLYPAYMNGCRLISMFTFIDIERELTQAINTLLMTNVGIVAKLNEMENYMLRKRGGNNGEQKSGEDGVERRGEENLTANVKMQRKEAERKLMEHQAKTAQKSGGIPSWVFMVGLWLVFQFIGGK